MASVNHQAENSQLGVIDVQPTDTPPIASGTALAPLEGIGALDLKPGTPEFREHVERGAAELARVFRETTGRIRRAWAEVRRQCAILDDTMKDAVVESHFYRHFDIGLYYDGSHQYDHKGDSAIDRIIKKMNVRVWALLIDKMGIKNIMSIKRREEFDRQVEVGDVPEVTEENIVSVIMGLADSAAEFATEAAKETLQILTPSNGHYKTNSGFKVGRRVILAYHIERNWDGRTFRANYYREKNLIALDGTFHILDEKGPIRTHKTPLAEAIEAAVGGRGETDYFRFKCFKNGNLHVEFKRLDLVKKLNGLATGEYVLGQDPD